MGASMVRVHVTACAVLAAPLAMLAAVWMELPATAAWAWFPRLVRDATRDAIKAFVVPMFFSGLPLLFRLLVCVALLRLAVHWSISACRRRSARQRQRRLERRAIAVGKGNFGKGFGKGFEKGGKGGKGNRPRVDGGGPTVIYPSVYVSDVPVEYNEDTVKQLHDVLGLDANKLMGVKFLPSKDSSGQTGSAIFRYCDQDAADKAVQGIRGQPVQLGNGACKFLGARLAKAASWMVERGVQDPVDNGGTSLRDGPRDAPQKPKEKTAAPALPKAPGAGGAEAEWPGDGTDALDTSGMPVYQEEMPEEQWDGTEIREAGAL